MNALKYIMSFVAGAYIIYHIYTYGVNHINSFALALFIISLGAEWARGKKREEQEKNKKSDS